MATRVIIVRHGQSTYNAKKMVQGRCDESVLTDQGIADAQQVGKTIQEIPIDAYYPELGHGQHELPIRHAPVLRAADVAFLYAV